MTGENDPDCRRPMVWDEGRQNRQIWETLRRLIAIRKAYPALRYGVAETLFTANGACVYRQQYEHDEAIVMLNPRGSVHHVSFPTRSPVQDWIDPLNGERWTAQGGHLSMPYLPALTAKLLLPDKTKPYHR